MKALLAIFLGIFVSFAMQTKCSEEYSLSVNNKNDSTDSFVCATYNVCSGEQAGNLNTSLHDWSMRNCMCDKNCKIYGDCCLDSLYYNATEQKVNYPLFQCTEISGNRLYVKTSCPVTYLDSKIKSYCENYTLGDESEDPKQMKFAFDVQNKIIYGNEYCAQCNGVTNTESSNLTFICITDEIDELAPSLPEFSKIFENVHFDSATKTFYSSYNGTTYPCKHKNGVPEHLQSLIHDFRLCLPKIISTCRDAYEEKTANLCKSFTSVVYTDRNKIYRNKYCAECNAEKNNLYSCSPPGQLIPEGRSFSGLFKGAGKLGDYNACASNNNAVLSKFC